MRHEFLSFIFFIFKSFYITSSVQQEKKIDNKRFLIKENNTLGLDTDTKKSSTLT